MVLKGHGCFIYHIIRKFILGKFSEGHITTCRLKVAGFLFYFAGNTVKHDLSIYYIKNLKLRKVPSNGNFICLLKKLIFTVLRIQKRYTGFHFHASFECYVM